MQAGWILVEGALLGLHSCMVPAFLFASSCRSSAAAVTVVAGGAFPFHKRGGHNIHFIVLLIALLIVASFVVSFRAPARIGVGLSSYFVRTKNSSSLIITLKLAESLTTAQTIAEKKRFSSSGVQHNYGMMAPIERPANETIQQQQCQDPTNWNDTIPRMKCRDSAFGTRVQLIRQFLRLMVVAPPLAFLELMHASMHLLSLRFSPNSFHSRWSIRSIWIRGPTSAVNFPHDSLSTAFQQLVLVLRLLWHPRSIPHARPGNSQRALMCCVLPDLRPLTLE